MRKILLSLSIYLIALIFLTPVAYAQKTPANLTCDDLTDLTTSFSKTGFTGEDVKVTVHFKNPSLTPAGKYRVLVSTGDTLRPWGGYQDQELDFSDKKSSIDFIIPGSNLNNAYTYKVYLQEPGYITWTNNTMCEFPGSINIFSKNFADLGAQCKINMSENYRATEQIGGSVFIPNDSNLKFNFMVFKDHIKNSLPKVPTRGPTGVTTSPVINLGTPNVTDTPPQYRVLVPGENTLQINDVSRSRTVTDLGVGNFTAVILARTTNDSGGVTSNFFCNAIEFQISRDETTAVVPGTPQTAPGAQTGEALTFPPEELKSCLPDSKYCTTSKPQVCPSGEGIMTAIGCVPSEPRALVAGLLKYGALAAGGVAFLIMILASLQMITAEGNPEAIKNAREKFYSAIIGLLLIIFATLLMQVIGVDLLGLPGFGNKLS